MTQNPLRWGVIGPGKIAHQFAVGLAETDTGVLMGAASRDRARAEEFLRQHGGDRAYGDYQALLDDPEIDAVYIATPNPFHARWAIQAARAGKHILCEKPLTLNFGEAAAVVDAAEVAGVALLEAFMYRCHPQTRALYDLVAAGAVGNVIRIRAEFAFDAGPHPESRLLANTLGGGGILDVGCYPLSAIRLLAGAALGKQFAEPVGWEALGHLDETTGVDTWASAVMKFERDIIGEAFCGVRARADNQIQIFGTTGRITVPQPWSCRGEIIRQEFGKEPQSTWVKTDKHLYRFEIEALAKMVASGTAPHPAMSVEDTLGNMRMLDQWRRKLGLQYEREKPGPNYPSVHGGPLGSKGDDIPTGQLKDIAKPASRVVLGYADLKHFPDVAPLFDEFFERGGNFFDDAFGYRNLGKRPSFAGQWMKIRGVREQCVFLDKGAHTPFCWPPIMGEELDRMIETSHAGYIDIYMMHRDNPLVPVGEFIDVINRMIDEEKVRAYGLSNWSISRVKEAIAYARVNGLREPMSISNQFSLAEMVNPVWPGCHGAHDAEFQACLATHDLALIPWSAQATGFFTDQSGPGMKPANPLLEHGYYSTANFERKRRASQLAAQKGVSPLNIVLAWVLQQPFSTFPIIGPRDVREIRTTLPAFSINLAEDEVEWLDLRS